MTLLKFNMQYTYIYSNGGSMNKVLFYTLSIPFAGCFVINNSSISFDYFQMNRFGSLNDVSAPSCSLTIKGVFQSSTTDHPRSFDNLSVINWTPFLHIPNNWPVAGKRNLMPSIWLYTLVIHIKSVLPEKCIEILGHFWTRWFQVSQFFRTHLQE